METFTAFSTRFLPGIVELLLRSLVLLTLTGLALFVLRRASAAIRHLVLALAAVSLLLLPLLSLCLPAWNIPTASLYALPPPPVSSPAVIPQEGTAPAVPIRSVLLAAEPSLSPVAASKNAVSEVVPLSPVPASPAAPPVPRTPAALVALWALGTILLLCRSACGLFHVRGLARNAEPAASRAPWLAEEGATLANALGVQQSVRLLVGASETPGLSPMTWGWLRPVVLLPANALGWQSARIRPVLLHELAHVQRGDWATELIARLVCALYWPNPLVWLLVRRLQSESERACDDRAVQVGIAPADYAGHLVEVVRDVKVQRQVAAPVALTMGRKSDVEGRVRAILSGNRSRKPATPRLALAALVATAGLLLPLASLRGVRAGGPEASIPPIAASRITARAKLEASVRAKTQDLYITASGTSYYAGFPKTYRKPVWSENGVRIELLPVFGKLADGKWASWYPDGSHAMPFKTRGTFPDNTRMVVTRVSFPTRALAQQTLVQLKFKNSPLNPFLNCQPLGKIVAMPADNAPFVALGRSFPASQTEETLQVRLAMGDRTTVIAGPPTRTTTRHLPTGEVITLSPMSLMTEPVRNAPRRTKQYALVEMTIPAHLVGQQSDYRFLIIGKNGQSLTPPYLTPYIPEENKPTATLKVAFDTAEVPLSKIREFRFVTRPIRVIEIPGIALQPKHTTVQRP